VTSAVSIPRADFAHGRAGRRDSGGVGEGREDYDFAVAGIDGVLALALDHLTQSGELGVARCVNLGSLRVERGQSVSVLDEVLLPATRSTSLSNTLTSGRRAGSRKRGRRGPRPQSQSPPAPRLALDAGKRRFHVPQLALHREGEGRHRAFHPLEHVDAHQVGQALFAVGLSEEALAAANLGAVLLIVRLLLV